MNKKVLIVEDEKDIAQLLKLHLETSGFHCDWASDGKIGFENIQNNHYDLIILDLMLPHIDGLALCNTVRQQENYTPILILTAKSSEPDRILGLELGADDYITKPFSILELIARIKALFRRIEVVSRSVQPPESDISVLKRGELQIDAIKREVKLAENILTLTAKEFDLLYYFAQNPGKVFNRSQLLDEVWGYSYQGYEHTVNSHINRLRAKIEQDANQPHYILTVWGVGYKFSDDF